MSLPTHLYGFQHADALTLTNRGNQFVLLPPGAGKSVISIAAAEALDAFTVLVICPAIVREDWRQKFRQFGRNAWHFEPGASGRRAIVRSYESINNPAKQQALVAELQHVDILIVDEGQRAKNPRAACTRSLYGEQLAGDGLCAIAGRVWVMSGTIAPNHWGELYPHLRALFPQALLTRGAGRLNYQEFVDRYCTWEPTLYGIRVTGNKNVDELRRLLAGHSIYRSREVVESMLPPLRESMTALPAEDVDREAWAAFKASADGLRLADAVQSSDALLGGDTHELELSTARRLLGMLKAPVCAHYIRELLENDEFDSLLVFAHHREVLHLLDRELCDFRPALIHGGIPELQRHVEIQRLQSGSTRLLLAGIDTAREGVTMTAANRVLLIEPSWTPSRNEQAIRRAFRIGQKRPVLAEYLYVADTLDELVINVCARKSALLNEVLQ